MRNRADLSHAATNFVDTLQRRLPAHSARALAFRSIVDAEAEAPEDLVRSNEPTVYLRNNAIVALSLRNCGLGSLPDSFADLPEL